MVTELAAAGVWLQPPGAVYLQLGWAGLTSSRTFDEQGVARAQTDATFLGSYGGIFSEGTYASHDLVAYAEAGIVRGLEIDVSLPIRYAESRWTFATDGLDPVVQRNAGPSDLSVGARAGGKIGSIALSGVASLRAPLYDNAPKRLRTEAGNSDFYDDRVPLGPGTIDGELGGDLGAPLGVLDGWVQGGVGIRVRNRGYSAAIPARLQVGIQPAGRVATWLATDGAGSLGNGTAQSRFIDDYGKGTVAIDRQSWLTATAGASVEVADGFQVLATLSRVIAARRFPLATSAMLAVSWHGEDAW